MNIVFFCQSCGARFEVPPSSAGKKGRCKKCGQMMAIPQAQELASMVAMPALVGAGAGHARSAPTGGNGAPIDWLAQANSNVGLAPLTMDRLPIGGSRKPVRSRVVDDDLGDSKPYVLDKPVLAGVPHHQTYGRPVSGLKMVWRKELGIVQRAFRWLNETAYLVSVPFLMLILLGAIFRSRPLALLGATAVVLLNLGRIVSGIANLVVVPFREGITQGVMFLIPPMTFFYLSRHWNKLKKPTMRIVGPIVTIGLVALAFTVIPSLRRDGKAANLSHLKTDLGREVKSLKGEMIGEIKKAKTIDVERLGEKAEAELRDAAGKVNSIGQPGGPQ